MSNVLPRLRIRSNPEVLTIDPQGLIGGAQQFTKFYVEDSMLPGMWPSRDPSIKSRMFFPRGEMQLPDDLGFIVEGHGPVEEAHFNIELATPAIDDTYPFTTDMAVERMDIIGCSNEIAIKGEAVIFLKSFFSTKDFALKSIYTGSLNTVVDQVADLLGIGNITENPVTTNPDVSDVSKIITNTLNTGNWYQSGKKLSQFLTDHARYASSSTETPFFTFINSRGQFYFADLDTIVNQPAINPTIPYELISTRTGSPQNVITSNNALIFIGINFAATQKNEQNYVKIANKINGSSGNYDITYPIITDHLPGTVNGIDLPKTTILSSKTSNPETEARSNFYYGIEYDTQQSLYNGKLINEFIDSAFPFRMPVKIPFNPDAVSGRNINLLIYTAFPDSESTGPKQYVISPEFSGQWTILMSTLVMTRDNNHIPYQELLVGRPKIGINDENPLRSSFL